jgi:two-component system CheB/CheR fusion protein
MEGSKSEIVNKQAMLGIGLPFAREIIDRHGGTIGVDSREGEGSVFYFALPLRG